MPLEIGNVLIEYESFGIEVWILLAFIIFHIAMIIKAIAKQEWVWLVLIIIFPILDIIYVFK